MKSKIVLFLIFVGLAIHGCSSTQDATGKSDSVSDSIIPDTTTLDTVAMDVSIRPDIAVVMRSEKPKRQF